jgi:hypothetical protein
VLWKEEGAGRRRKGVHGGGAPLLFSFDKEWLPCSSNIQKGQATAVGSSLPRHQVGQGQCASERVGGGWVLAGGGKK